MPTLLLLSTTHDIPGYKTIAYKGLVKGMAGCYMPEQEYYEATVRLDRSPLIELSELSRDNAQLKMELSAAELDANAIIGVKFDTKLRGNESETMCYGTAIRVEKL